MKKKGASKKSGAAKKGGPVKKDDAAKKGGAADGGGESLSSRLKGLTAGLLFQSESDYPVEPFEEKAAGAASARDFVALKGTEGAAVRELDFSFFADAVKEQDWHDEEARARVKKFQALVKFLKESLTDIKVYRVGGTEADIYVVGKTAAGDFAGVKTKVVET
jgi:Nuclease A inhibitor-like protein